jgi:IS5 family transposase
VQIKTTLNYIKRDKNMYNDIINNNRSLLGGHLLDRLNPEHSLVRLSRAIDWQSLTREISQHFNPGIGRPSVNLRLICGLIMLQNIYDLSDSDVIQAWTENIYYQHFTGLSHFTTDFPCDPSTLSNFRKRIGLEGSECLFKHSVLIHDDAVFEPKTIIDSTVQKKYTTYPTDSKLISAVISQCWKYADHLEISLSPDYRVDVVSLKKNINFAKSIKSREVKESNINSLRTIANDLLDQITSKVHPDIAYDPIFVESMSNYRKAVNQKKNDGHKIYSIYEPDVACIAKGKSHAKYEFGCKVSFVIGMDHKIILGVTAFKGAPYDGDTLKDSFDMINRNFPGYKPELAVGDLGYRGRDQVNGIKIFTPDNFRNATNPDEKKEIGEMLVSRSSIEPIIGHLKSDHKFARNMLHGFIGDEINAILSATGFNLRKYARIEDNKFIVADNSAYSKRIRRPLRKTKSVPFCKPVNTVRLFPKSGVITPISLLTG